MKTPPLLGDANANQKDRYRIFYKSQNLTTFSKGYNSFKNLDNFHYIKNLIKMKTFINAI